MIVSLWLDENSPPLNYQTPQRLHRENPCMICTLLACCVHVRTWFNLRLWVISVVFPIDCVIGSDLQAGVSRWSSATDMMGIVKGVVQWGSCLINSSRCSSRDLFEVSEILSGKQRLSLCDLHTLSPSFSWSVSLGVCLVAALKIEKVWKKELFGLWTTQKHPDSFWCLCLFKMSSTHKELF